MVAVALSVELPWMGGLRSSLPSLVRVFYLARVRLARGAVVRACVQVAWAGCECLLGA